MSAINLDLSAYPKQHDFLMDDHRYVGFIGGISTGKTNGGIKKAIKKALEYPGSHGTITAPTYTMLNDTTYRTFREVCPPELIHSETKQPLDVKLYTPKQGVLSEIHFRSTHDPESLRGPNLLWGFMDEASLSSKEALEIMQGRIRDNRFPGKAQQMWVTTTPKGLNWVFDLFGPNADPKRFATYYVETKDNPFNSAEFIEDIYQQYKGQWAQQELSAQFVAAKGLIYGPYFDQQKHVLKRTDEDPNLRSIFGNEFGYFDDQPIEFAWDFGYPSPSAALFFQQDARGRVFIIDEVYRYRTLEEEVLADMRSRSWFGNVQHGLGDSARPDTIDRLSNMGLPIAAADKGRILDGIDKVRTLLSIDPVDGPRLFVHPRCENLIKEISQYRWAEHRVQDDSFSDKPIDAFNHALDALRYWATNRWHPSGGIILPSSYRRDRRGEADRPKRRVMAYQLD